MQPRGFSVSFIVLSTKWLAITFPATIAAIPLGDLFAPSAFSRMPGWVLPVVAVAAPLVLGLISACVLWRRGVAATAETVPQSVVTPWLSSAIVTRWLYLIVLPIFIVGAVLLGTFAPGVFAAIPSRFIVAIPMLVVLPLVALRIAAGVGLFRNR
jgi:hypothetical protein